MFHSLIKKISGHETPVTAYRQANFDLLFPFASMFAVHKINSTIKNDSSMEYLNVHMIDITLHSTSVRILLKTSIHWYRARNCS